MQALANCANLGLDWIHDTLDPTCPSNFLRCLPVDASQQEMVPFSFPHNMDLSSEVYDATAGWIGKEKSVGFDPSVIKTCKRTPSKLSKTSTRPLSVVTRIPFPDGLKVMLVHEVDEARSIAFCGDRV